jgi:hypothetical protein
VVEHKSRFDGLICRRMLRDREKDMGRFCWWWHILGGGELGVVVSPVVDIDQCHIRFRYFSLLSGPMHIKEKEVVDGGLQRRRQ